MDHVNERLRPGPSLGIEVVDLFAGCGGLSLGFEAVGFTTVGFEIDEDCCRTYGGNLIGDCTATNLSPDHDFPYAPVLIGGPPCQPFSVGGDQRGKHDSRDGLPTFVAAVRATRPEIFLFENVRGVLYRNKAYFSQFLNQLKELGYHIDARLVNAVNHGVPQNRERVIVVGHSGGFSFPEPSHRKVTAGEALGDMWYSTPPESRFLTASMDDYVARYERASKCINPRDLDLTRPARTLTCRNLAGATGDMQRVRLPDGRRRRLLIREAARLQTFPDWFEFRGRETSQFNQVGNAVPPILARALALSVLRYLGITDRQADDRVTEGRGCVQAALPLT